MSATHNPNIALVIALAAAVAIPVTFGTLLGIFPAATNSLDGDTTREYTADTGVTDAVQDVADGFLSTAAQDWIIECFSQNPRPASVKIGNIDLSDASPATKALKDFADVGAGSFDTIIEAHSAGIAGNLIEVALIPDSASSVSIEVFGSASVGYTVVIHYKPAVSTVGNIETAITALSGVSDVIDVKTAGTGATVLAAGEAVESALATGVDAVATETYAAAIARIQADDDTWYAVSIASRAVVDVAAASTAIEALKKVFIAQCADTGLYGTMPGGFSAILANERTLLCYHATSTVYLDAGLAANRLAYDLDTQCPAWDCNVAGITATTLTAAQRSAAIANNVNTALPFGSADTFIDPGVSLAGRPFCDIITRDWLDARLTESLTAVKLNYAARGRKFPQNARGQSVMVAVIKAVVDAGIAAEHFDPGDVANGIPVPAITPLTITSADKAAHRMRATLVVSILGSVRTFGITVNLE